MPSGPDTQGTGAAGRMFQMEGTACTKTWGEGDWDFLEESMCGSVLRATDHRAKAQVTGPLGWRGGRGLQCVEPGTRVFSVGMWKPGGLTREAQPENGVI